MPEMPEVETMVARLQKYVGLTITAAVSNEIGSDRYLPGNSANVIINQTLNGIFRRGKFMVFMLDKGALLCHNAMSGYWDSVDEPWTFDYVEGAREIGQADIRAMLCLSRPGAVLESSRCLRFHDSRKFGSLKYFSPNELAIKLSMLGPEVVRSQQMYEPTDVIDEEIFIRTFQSVRKPIKVALTEQARMTGLGNIYAAEACHLANVDPRKFGRDCSREELTKLFSSSKIVVLEALDRNLDYSGLHVYRQKQCSNKGCGSKIATVELAGRTTYWCPACQH